MKNLLICCAVVLFASACGKSEPPNAAIESVDTLVANPDRLKDLRAQCKADHARLGDAQCNAVAEATRRRFLNNGTPANPAPPLAPPPSTATAASPASSSRAP